MSVIFEKDSRKESVVTAAKQMISAARTAPKARGFDAVIAAIADKAEITLLSEKLIELNKTKGAPDFFLRDAENILSADALVLIGTRIAATGIPFCGLCGFGNCAGKNRHKDAPCAFNTGDLGIAIGAAVSIAADFRIDNRVMFSVGIAARELKLLGEDAAIIYGIPLSASSKNPFFDRTWPKVK